MKERKSELGVREGERREKKKGVASSRMVLHGRLAS